MATQTYEQLIAGANKIKENELPESNTHDIVGEQLLQMTNKMQEENSNNGKKFSELEKDIDETIRGEFNATAKQSEDNFYDVNLPKGKIDIELQAPLYNSYAKLVLYNEEGGIISNPTGDSLYLEKGASKNYSLQILEDIKKVELKCSSGQVNVIIVSDGGLSPKIDTLQTDYNSYKNYIDGHVFGEFNAVAKQDENNIYVVDLPNGKIEITILAPKYASYCTLTLYNEEGSILNKPTGDSLYLDKGDSKKYYLSLAENIKKIELECRAGEVNCTVIAKNAIERQVKDVDISKGLQQIIDKENSRNIINVKKDGSGDFTNIQDAINSINDATIDNQYEIRVYDDYHIEDLTNLYLYGNPQQKNTNANPTKPIAYIITKDYVNLRGMNRRRKVSVHSPYELAGNSFQYVQCMYLQGNCIIDNIDFEIKNGRYAVHQESGGSKSSQDYNAITIIRNSNISHLGNRDSADGGVSWTAICGQANGTCSGLKEIFENVNWSPIFYAHNNINFDAPSHFKFKNCSIIPNGEGNNQGGYIETFGCGQNFTVEIEGCNFIGMDVRPNVSSQNVLTDACHDIRTHVPTFIGKSNTNNLLCRIIYSQYVLMFKTTDNNKSISVVGGTAKELIWGDDFMIFAGTADAVGVTLGTEYIKDRAFTLGKRLGDCSSVNKTLIVKIDNDAEQTITFSKNYTSVGNPEIVSDINQQITGAIASITADKDNTTVCYPLNDCYEVATNHTDATILFGMPLIRDIGNSFGWKICPVGEKPEGIACERINPNEFGKVAYLKNNTLKSIRDLNISSNYAKVTNNGYWGNATKEDADIVQYANGIWKISV